MRVEMVLRTPVELDSWCCFDESASQRDSLQRCMFVTFVCVFVFFLRIVTGCMFVVLFRAVFAPVF